MKIKVCGIRNQANLAFLNAAEVDFIGFIFYSKSSRNFHDGDIKGAIQSGKKKVGVFVNEAIEEVERLAEAYQLDYLQLHGDESPAYCKQLKTQGYKLLKAFSIYDQLPSNLEEYESVVDYFLFDTKGVSYGGNGTQFDWRVLDEYQLKTPFILSGGIGTQDVVALKSLSHPLLYAVDVNSKFEMAPGLKDEHLLGNFIEELKK
ncbi:phosphoribosylanthranilate isomerase [Reichenbachiella faecimaris]|uniref:N-(5'-phosphoribosyl)anthranilate isomerase n=1 Tax=Reichenbachiella faecimaris TaxID=692418 RepID=A0A1W2G4Q3_REIFA|nr:phosphoribosylanthranilate isomerase [Reichenbachiella faecimaris]SMD31647.1 phosphoribosylanthranilate isomerase [Reichenbachiella faecimaris]